VARDSTLTSSLEIPLYKPDHDGSDAPQGSVFSCRMVRHYVRARI
jgi:hypothetical protein